MYMVNSEFRVLGIGSRSALDPDKDIVDTEDPLSIALI